VIEGMEKSLKWSRIDPALFYTLFDSRTREAWDDTVAMWQRVSGTAKPDLGRSAREIDADIKDPALRKIFREIYLPGN
jgi:hypothetical protein